jgi:hypothetical protein
MALDPNLTLKDNSGDDVVFSKVDNLPSRPGTLRSNNSVALPDKETLYIRSQDIGKGATSARQHTLTNQHTLVDSNGLKQVGSASLSIIFPDSPEFATAVMEDMVHLLLDLIISTATFAVDSTALAQILRGES